MPVLGVRDILGEQTITRIPLAPPEIAGSLNLRGRIVTAIDLRRRLRLPPPPPGQPRMSVVAEQGGELYALLVDQVSEVMSLKASAFERNPPTLPTALGGVQQRHLPARWPAAGGAGCRAAAGARRSGAEARAMARTCLVVDDSRVVRKVARRILEAHGFTVAEAGDGQQALEACRDEMPDCVLLDWNMPVMNGLDFLKRAARRVRPGQSAGGVLHDRDRHGVDRAGDRERRAGIHHEAVRRGDPARQVRAGRAAVIARSPRAEAGRRPRTAPRG